MNSLSLILNGRTAADLALLPERQQVSITTLYRPRQSASGSPMLGPKRPSYRRQTSRDSPGWYYTDGGMTLDDFARRLNTTLARIEQWQTRCAQNVVMALMRPTPIVLFVFNPISLLLWFTLMMWWFLARAGTNQDVMIAG